MEEYIIKLQSLYGIFAEHTQIIIQVACIAISTVAVLAVVILKQIWVRLIKERTSFNNKFMFCLIKFYKEIIGLIMLLVLCGLLHAFNFDKRLLLFSINILVASIISRTINIITMRKFSYTVSFLLLLFFVVLDSEYSPMQNAQIQSYKIFGLSLTTAIRTILVAFTAFFTSKNLHAFVRLKIHESNIDANAKIILSQINAILLAIFSALTILKTANIDTKIFTVFTGAVGVGVGLGLQKFVAKVSNGMMIIMDKNIKVGDKVTISTHTGTIKNITSKNVQLILDDHSEVLVPNDVFTSSIVVNHSRSDIGKIDMRINIDINSDSEMVCGMVKDIISKMQNIALEPEPGILAESITTRGIVLHITFQVNDKSATNSVKNEFISLLCRKFKTEGICLYQEPSQRI